MRWLAGNELLAGLGGQPLVLDDVSGRLAEHVAVGVESLAPRAAGDLLEITDAEDAGLLAIVLAEL